MHKNLDADWKNWIWSNIKNGVSKDSVFYKLMQEGFATIEIINTLNYIPSNIRQTIENMSQQSDAHTSEKDNGALQPTPHHASSCQMPTIINDEAAIYYFQKKKYLRVDHILDKHLCDHLAKVYHEKSINESVKKQIDAQCSLGSKSWVSQPQVNFLLIEMLPRLEALTGLRLLPTYSYLRFYVPGEELHKHLDRPSCEVSVTLTLSKSSDYDWPIGFANPDDLSQHISASCPAYSAVVYRGCEVPHWRAPFTPPASDDWQIQVFLHYVERFGKNKEYAYDGKDKLLIQPFGNAEVYKRYQSAKSSNDIVKFEIVEA